MNVLIIDFSDTTFERHKHMKICSPEFLVGNGGIYSLNRARNQICFSISLYATGCIPTPTMFAKVQV